MRLEAAIDEIDQSSCVLIFLTEMYKENPYCRLEFQYVVQSKKPFIPLILQKDFKPDGW